ncbi:MAG: TRAP transporter substrate-binding protein DctP [Deltaproteobacteria bacterium]|nr:TRAP transporter substrate-binding protein DctP [Deltaproteobacteria bacterium]MBI3076996.1 TRAP transporter substrate-binding protein DctP [Deltaproteobacteria bacterium]
MSRWQGLLVGVVIGLLALGGWRGEAWGQRTLKFAHAARPGTQYDVAAQKFKELVEERTSGALKIQIFPGGQLGYERDIVEGLQIGTIDSAVITNAVVAAFFPKLMVFDLPFIFADGAHARKVVDGPIGQQLLDGLTSIRLKGLAFAEGGFRSLINSKMAVRTVEDLRKLKFRVMETPLYISLFRAMQGTAIPMSMGEVYTSLQQGVIDGLEIPTSVMRDFKFHKIAPYVSLTEHTYSPIILLMNIRLYQGLPSQTQQILVQAARDAAAIERKFVDDSLKADLDALTKEGAKVNAVEKKGFQERARLVHAEYEGKIGKDLLEAVLKTRP